MHQVGLTVFVQKSDFDLASFELHELDAGIHLEVVPGFKLEVECTR